jgi:hypothetical protein
LTSTTLTASKIIDNTNDIIRTYRKSSEPALDGSQTCEDLSDEDDEGQNDDSGEGGDNEVSESGAISTEHAEPRPSDSGMFDKIPHAESTEMPVFYPTLSHEYPARPQIEGRMPVESSAHEIGMSVDLDHIFDDGFGNSLWDSVMSTGPFTPPFSLGLGLSRKATPAPELDFPIDESQTLTLLRSFLTESATWCETTDTSKQFSVVCAHDMLDHKIFKASALALACRQLSITGYSVEDVALQLYQYTIQLLIQQSPDHADAFILAACTLLCVYEMMASEVLDWRRHLKVQNQNNRSLTC